MSKWHDTKNWKFDMKLIPLLLQNLVPLPHQHSTYQIYKKLRGIPFKVRAIRAKIIYHKTNTAR